MEPPSSVLPVVPDLPNADSLSSSKPTRSGINPTPPTLPPPYAPFASRRSTVHSRKGLVACSQPLAASCGLDILRKGGNAADAAVAVAAGLNVTEPCSTGIGGDMFLLYRDAATGRISALNGSGRIGAKYTLDLLHKELGVVDNQSDATTGKRKRSESPSRPITKIPPLSVHAVTVPGAAAGWVDTVTKYGSGKLSLDEILAPAIDLAENGFPLSELAAQDWMLSENKLRSASPNFAELLKRDPDATDGFRAPRTGEIMRNPNLAETFRTLARDGKKGFYTGRIANEIVAVCQARGSHLEIDDLTHHLESTESLDSPVSSPVPISLTFSGQGLAAGTSPNGQSQASAVDSDKSHDSVDRSVVLWEHPPNGQGLVALMALGIIQEMELQGKIPVFTPAQHNSVLYLHTVIEALRLGFTDGNWYIADPDYPQTAGVPLDHLLSKQHLAQRAALFDPQRALDDDALELHNASEAPPSLNSCDTVYFSVVDAAGNAASFINSNYGGFGTHIVPRGCGFTLQNRGSGFSLEPGHPNAAAPRKRPYHTIIPGMVTMKPNQSPAAGASPDAQSVVTGDLHSVFGVMGGFMQPQGHVQVLLGQIVAGFAPQEALDAPRICVEWDVSWAEPSPAAKRSKPEPSHDQQRKTKTGWKVNVEHGIDEKVIQGLRELGHNVTVLKGRRQQMFGRGQVIRRMVDPVEGTVVWSAGSDPRCDGGAYPE